MNVNDATTGQLPFRFGNYDRVNFDLFLPGENTGVYQQLQQLSTGKTSTCIYLWGQKGTGKSHLLQATCRNASESGRNSIYIPSTQFDEIEPTMLQGLGSLDLVCVDDIDYLADNQAWEHALLHLYNQLRDAQHSIVIAGNAAPNVIGIQLQDLKSRLSWGLTYYLKQLDDETKMAVLKKRAEHRSFELTDEVAFYLLSRVERDVQTLMGILDKIDDASLAEQRKITIPFVKTLLDK